MTMKANRYLYKMKSSWVILIGLFQLTTSMAFAQYYLGPITSGAGGAGRAAAEAGEGLLQNPAFLPHLRDVSSSFYYTNGGLTPQEKQTTFGLAIADNHEKVLFPGGLAYFQRKIDIEGMPSAEEKFFQVSAGNFLYEQISLGISLIYLKTDPSEGAGFNQINGVVGFLYNPHPDWGFGLVKYHFAKPGSEVPTYLRLMPSTAVALTYLPTDFLKVRFDVVRQDKYNHEHKLEYLLGLESMMNEFFIIRMGGGIDQLSQSETVSLGLTFDGPVFKVDYSFRKRADGQDGALHSVDMRAPF